MQWTHTLVSTQKEHKCRSRQYVGGEIDNLPKFPYICLKTLCHTLCSYKFLQLLLHYIFRYHVAVDLKIETLVLDVWFLTTQLKK